MGVNNVTVIKSNSNPYLAGTVTLQEGSGITLSQVGQTITVSASASGGLTVGTTTIASGTTTRILYDNAGTLGEYTISGSGNVAMTTSPVFTTPNIGSATGSVSGNAGTATALQNARTIGGVSFDGTANITVATATGGFTVSGGNLALGTNSLTLTGSIAATGARVTKGWFTDIESTNMPTVGGTAILTSLTAPQFTTIELGNASDTTLSRVSAGVIAVEGSTVALASNNLSFFSATTSAQLASVISDETGTGLLVFGTAPTFASTITVGTAGGTTGKISLKGTTSGTVDITTAAAAGTWTMTLPTTAGTNAYVLQTNGSGVTSWVAQSGGGGGGASTTQSVTQTSHGFAVKDVLKFAGGVYAKAQANSAANAEVVGIVSVVTDANTFTLLMEGYISTLSGLTANTTYFLDPTTAGALTATEPSTVGQVSKPLLTADSTTSGIFNNMRGMLITSAAVTLTSAHIFVGDGSNVAQDVAMSGDVTISNTGATTIGADKVVYTMLENTGELAIISAFRFLSGN